MPKVDVNGIALHYEEQGAGAPVLLIMGLATQLIAWPPAFVDGPKTVDRSDPDFALWSLDDVRLLQAMTRWLALPQRRLVLVAHTYAAVERRHPRFVAWRRDWSHAVEAWSPETGVELALPTLWIDDRGTTVQVFDTNHWRGRAAHDDAAVRQWQGEIDALLQRSEAAFPVHPLGL